MYEHTRNYVGNKIEEERFIYFNSSKQPPFIKSMFTVIEHVFLCCLNTYNWTYLCCLHCLPAVKKVPKKENASVKKVRKCIFKLFTGHIHTCSYMYEPAFDL